MAYRQQFQPSISVSQESSFSEQCSICITFRRGFTIWIRQQHYARQSSYIGKYLKTINNIVKKSPGKHTINYRDVMMMADDRQVYELEYKNFDRVLQQVKQTIFLNLRDHQHYDKIYFGENNYSTMLRYQVKKKMILDNRQNSKSQSRQKFKITKSAYPTDSQNKILQDSTLKRKYDFYPVQMLQRQQRSKLQISLNQIYKLKKNLSTMICDIKTNEQSFPQIKNMTKPYIDFTKTKEQLKFRKKLQNNISEIHQDRRQIKRQQNYRLYTSPDLQDDIETQNKYVQAYGFILQQNAYKKKKKKSLLLKQISREKSSSNLSRTKLTNYTKSSRQATQQGSQLMISGNGNSTTVITKKYKSRSKLKGSSKNKILLASSSSGNKLRMMSPIIGREKSMNKSRKLVGQYK